MYGVSSSPYCGMNPNRGKNQAILLHNNTRPIFIPDLFAPYKRKMIKSYQRVTPFALFFFFYLSASRSEELFRNCEDLILKGPLFSFQLDYDQDSCGKKFMIIEVMLQAVEQCRLTEPIVDKT